MDSYDGYLQSNGTLLEKVKAYARMHHGNCFDLPPLEMRVSPGLVRSGETIDIKLSARSAEPPEGTLTVEADCFGPESGGEQKLALEWTQVGGGEWLATCSLVADRRGVWRFLWSPDTYRMSRLVSVTGPGQVVMTLWGGTNFPRLDQEIHRYDLPADHWVDAGFGKSPEQIVEGLKPFVRDAFFYGDRLAPVCNAADLLPGIPDKNLFKVPLHVQRQAFSQIRELWQLLGLGNLDLIASYTPGHGTFGLLHELGFKALNSLCVWQNWLDGASAADWQINHVGCPIAPYYPASDDFRKAGVGGGLLAFSMGTSSNVRCYDIMCFDGCPTNCIGKMRYWRLPGVGSNVHRFFAAMDGWIHDTRNNREPVFVTTGLENFYSCPESLKQNQAAIDYMVRRAGEGKVVFASAVDIADFYHRHYAVQPEQINFQPDTMLGIRGWSKPAWVPDRIEVANSQFHSVHQNGENLPQFLWDYTTPWQNPEWSYQWECRDTYGFVLPSTIAATVNPNGCVPRQTDLRGLQVTVIPEALHDGAGVTVRIESPTPIRLLPVALWRLPLDPECETQVLAVSPGARWIPVRDGWSHNFNGILALSDVPAGVSTWSLNVSGTRKSPETIDFTVDGLLTGRTMRMTEETRTYLWRESVNSQLRVQIGLPPGSAAFAMYLDGSTVRPDATGNLELILDEHWSHEAPTLVNAAPISCGGDAVIRVTSVQPIHISPDVLDWRVSPVLATDDDWNTLTAPNDAIALRLTSHRIKNDFSAVNLGQLTGGAEGAVVYQMARFHASERTRVCVDLGYDGPVKAWLDGRLLFFYPKGTPPWAIEGGPAFESEPGEHEVLFAFGPNAGMTWGVRLRIMWAGEEMTPDRYIPSAVVPPDIRILS